MNERVKMSQRIQIPGNNGGVMPVVQQMQVASPINDIQLVALLAVGLQGSTEERVVQAHQIVAAAYKQRGELQRMIREQNDKESGGNVST